MTQRIVTQSTSQTNSTNMSEADRPVGNSAARTSAGTSAGVTENVSFTQTPLLYPSDVRELPPDEQILFIEGHVTIQWRVQWFRDWPYATHKDYLAKRAAALEDAKTALAGRPVQALSQSVRG